jgi:endonuclease/exonuclease/phosphatase family metal-dependent hydrolase
VKRLAIALLALACGPALCAPALKLASWNAEWLVDAATLQRAGHWTRCPQAADPRHGLRPDLPPCDAYPGIEDEEAYARRKLEPVRATLATLAAHGADVIALQEVRDLQALHPLLPPGYRALCFTTQAQAQNLAFVVRDALAARASCREIGGLSLERDAAPHPQRRGLELRLGALRVLNLHLKSGCAMGGLDAPDKPACELLRRQGLALHEWLEDTAQDEQTVVVGDFNRDLRAEAGGERSLWSAIAAGGKLRRVRVERGIAHAQHCRFALDQIAAAPSIVVQARLLPRSEGASDHCPLWAELSSTPGRSRAFVNSPEGSNSSTSSVAERVERSAPGQR